ncbi:MAG: phosphoribosylglycinamide formyltransferase [Gammaproteobacteria bacterium]|jgi:phosphoribosylglycinamide formyltransferase-1|nr:phosphoribosylglycinamide formyltransferase [Gammaproteobacteria bacterium]
MKISFLASHGGSSAKAIIAAINNGELNAETGILITNNSDSAIYQWCKENAFPVQHISSSTHNDEEDASILAALKDAGTDIVVCSGYMKMIGLETLAGFESRILNIHPALLPLYGGVGMYGDKVHAAVLVAGDAESGATVHIVTEHYDEGPVIGQSQVDVLPDDTVESLRQRVQETETGLYIECLKKFLNEF